ncbi:DnaD domain protein [Alicyclobacillus dauci]|uniref:DnaD domain protein n=1 Tax=Alicyclobacillus dauci TaxID=1475485 RepID=A0ABY6YWV3_9BACL|nr:DnaD domain protein [Alicyclobacillus dauci]WAH35014.1 DnaD domain protein [Alicyclobacillus dauci]
MQLHNRQIKATFWKDPELVQWPRDLRWFYEGLIQLADDSGCLEDSPFAFKLELYPSPTDSDVTVEVIEGWRDHLVSTGKLVPYTSGNKQCLYLYNFQKHQVLKSPQQPDVPLPEWIEWAPYDSNPRAGKYTVNRDVLTEFLQSSYKPLLREVKRREEKLIQDQEKKQQGDTVLSALREMSATQEQKHSLSLSNDNRLAKVSRLYQESGMGQVNDTVKRFLLEWLDIYSDEWIENAFREAVLQNKRRPAYVNSILQNWTADGGMKITITTTATREAKSRHGPGERTEPSEYGEDVRDAFYRGWET